MDSENEKRVMELVINLEIPCIVVSHSESVRKYFKNVMEIK